MNVTSRNKFTELASCKLPAVAVITTVLRRILAAKTQKQKYSQE